MPNPYKQNSLKNLRLTRQEMSSHSGCLSKLPALELEDLLLNSFGLTSGRMEISHPMDRPEDCAYVEMESPEVLLTNDFGPLVGVDLYLAGRIASLHAMSDVYACGGVPKYGLSIMIVKQEFPKEYSHAVLTGMLQAASDEKVNIIGGHTIIGSEPIAGLAIIGQKGPVFLPKGNTNVGEHILLSKPLGTGMAIRAYKMGRLDDNLLNEALTVMLTSNKNASQIVRIAGATSSTDVSGFGFLGHLTELLNTGHGARIFLKTIPFLSSTKHLSVELLSTFWTQGNLEYVNDKCNLTGNTTRETLLPLLDPQTNGGLLVSVPAENTQILCNNGFTKVGVVTDKGKIVLE